MTTRRSVFAAATVAVIVVAAAVTVFFAQRHHSVPMAGAAGPTAEGDIAVEPLANARDPWAVAIHNAQLALKANVGDDRAWAQLGAAYVQEARITVNPMYYQKAGGALRRSLALNRTTNLAATVGMGTLANAQHNFKRALAWGHSAQRLNRYNIAVYAVLDDALTQLGRYPEATAATQRMLDLRPDISSFTRASYDFEERGDIAGARFALQRALQEATSPADIAFCRYYLGELAFNQGKPADAAYQYDRGLQVDPNYDPLMEGKAKAEAALGKTAAAINDYTTVVNRVPQPQYVIELGELQQSLGHRAQAQQEYDLLAVELKLFAANGVIDDLTPAQYNADHGNAATALSHARAEWARRHSVLVADALAWALHANHQDGEALTYARYANHLGWRNATFSFHQGMIEAALGQTVAARADLTRALRINPYFNPIQAPLARRSLQQLSKAP